MDASLRVKPIGAAPARYARADSSSLRAAVATELDPSQTVTAALDTPAATDDLPRNAPPLPQQISQDVLIDSQAREVMFRAMVARSGRAVRHAPGDAATKLQAYRDCASEQDAADGPLVEKTA